MCTGVGTEEQEAAAAAALAGLPAATDGRALGGGAICQWQARVLRDLPHLRGKLGKQQDSQLRCDSCKAAHGRFEL